jgi:NitT/TauT family transport system permease protein
MRRAHSLLAIWPPLVFGLVFLAVWETIVAVYDIKKFLLPAPTAIASAFAGNLENVWEAVLVTGANALVGFVLGVLLGIAVSFVLMRFRVFNELTTPLAVAINAVPIVIIVPVLNNMYPAGSQVPRRIMVVLIVFVNVAKGLRQVSGTHMELMRSYAASPREILVKTRIPNAIPYLFTAMKIAAPLSVITAFVAEYFGGTQTGLGSAITSNASQSKNDVMWAYVLGACLLGLSFYAASIWLEKATTRQHQRNPAMTR